jgi:hypothetical protein
MEEWKKNNGLIKNGEKGSEGVMSVTLINRYIEEINTSMEQSPSSEAKSTLS